ncbi:nuclear transport factor 2 family protein [Granulicoccus sp. GXG6511]|uniref:nuclear transport factor 2 family protein n=1 Tax=Granulicoccus sp. GXG6511 TaxID=3381351 RepID=UPI003D7D109D
MDRTRAHEPNQLLQLLVERVADGDVEGLVALFEDDAALDTGGGVARGAAALREFWDSFVASGVAVEVGAQSPPLIAGELALTSTVMPDGGVTVEIARRQSDGSWRWVVDQPSLNVTSRSAGAVAPDRLSADADPRDHTADDAESSTDD